MKRVLIASTAVLLITAAFVVARANSIRTAVNSDVGPQHAAATSEGAGGRSGVKASPQDMPGTNPDAPDQVASATRPSSDPIGTVRPVPQHANPQVQSVEEALQTRTHPERLTPLIQPAPFSLVAYEANPQAYADVVEPGRAFQSAVPGPDVPVLAPVGSTAFSMTQDGNVILRVRTKPGMPVTYTSFDLGHFSNSLVSQTVVADEQGIAAVQFLAGPGTIDAVHVQAASPVASGYVSFEINVTPAKTGKDG